MNDANAQVKARLMELMRMSTGDKLSLRVWYDEAQQLARFAREKNVCLPGEVMKWLAGAEERTKDPLRAATETADIARYLSTLA